MKKIIWIVIGILTCSFIYQTTIQTGQASYYHNKFEGRKTSSGEIFRQDSLTAAHKNLPFGTLILVKNLKNDLFLNQHETPTKEKSTMVWINFIIS